LVEAPRRERFPRVETMRHVDVASPREISHECRWSASHVRREDGRRLAQADRPPSPAMLRDEPAIGAERSSHGQKTFDGAALPRREVVELLRQVDHGAERNPRTERLAREEKLASARDRLEEHAFGQHAAVLSRNPDAVFSGGLSAMNPAELAE